MIKKPVLKSNKRAVVEEEEEAPKKLLKKKKAPVVEEEEEEEEDADEDADEEEVVTPPKKKKKKVVDEEEEDDDADEEEADEEEEEEAPRRKPKAVKKKSKSKKSLADIFDSTKPGRGNIPAGDYVAQLVSMEFEGEIADDPDDQEALKVKTTYEITEADDEALVGKTISNWSGIATDDGEPGPGIPFLKGDLDILGYEDVTLADLEDIFADLESTKPAVVIKVKQNGQYTNVYLQGLADGE